MEREVTNLKGFEHTVLTLAPVRVDDVVVKVVMRVCKNLNNFWRREREQASSGERRRAGVREKTCATSPPRACASL